MLVSIIILIVFPILLFFLVKYIQTPVLKPYNNPKYFVKKILPALNQDKKIVLCLGDSITHGLVSGNYVEILNNKHQNDHFQFINGGINSDLTWNVLQRIDIALRCQPDYVTILIGTNDCDGAFSPKVAKRQRREKHIPQNPTMEWFQSNLTELIHIIQNYTNPKTGQPPKIGIFSIPTIGEIPDEDAYLIAAKYVEAIKTIAKQANVTYFPLFETMHDILTKTDVPQKYHYPDINKLLLMNIFKRILFRRSLNSISAQHGFSLHPDYLHLNDQAAQIIIDNIEGFISGFSGKSDRSVNSH